MQGHDLALSEVRSESSGTGYATSVARALCTTLVILGLTGATRQTIQAQVPPTAQTVSQVTGGTRAGSYRVQPGDMLQYRVWPNVELTGEFPVESSGVVFLPITGAVQVGGKTLDEVRALLRESYAKLVQGSTQPVVTVTAMFPFSVIGGVSFGGVFDGRAGMTVFDAISRAGGYRGDARPKYVDVIHADGTTSRITTGSGKDDGSRDVELTTILLRSQDRVSVPISHRLITGQNAYLFAQTLLGVITVIKLFGN
jgi:protein involved in polysaccharide export with SLBB domain